jgi:hypothetical protein
MVFDSCCAVVFCAGVVGTVGDACVSAPLCVFACVFRSTCLACAVSMFINTLSGHVVNLMSVCGCLGCVRRLSRASLLRDRLRGQLSVVDSWKTCSIL